MIPDNPYFGKTYVQPGEVLQGYPEPEVEMMTPAFTKEEENFTTQEEMMYFLSELHQNCPYMGIEIIGRSQEGREIPLVTFSKNPTKFFNGNDKPTVWLHAQIHGNEPAGGESALLIARQLAEGELGEEILDEINVVIVPRVNPDGSYYFTRETADGLDPNRDHLKLETPEVRTLHRAHQKYNPEVVIDAHEYGLSSSDLEDAGNEGALSYHDILLLSGKNLNIPEETRILADYLLLDEASEALTEQGFSNHPYYIVTGNNGEITISEGGTEGRIGRNAFGLKPSLSFLVESRGIGIGRENFKRRVTAQATTHASLLKTTAQHAGQILEVIRTSRNSNGAAAGQERVVITSELRELPNQELPFMDIETGKPVEIGVEYRSSTLAYPTLERARPSMYLLPPAYKQISRKLKTLGVKVQELRKAATIEVESYTVTDHQVDTNMYEGHFLNHVETEVSTQTMTFPAGSFLCSMMQPAGNVLPVVLEPESENSYVTYNYLSVETGDEIPVYRVL